MPQKEKRMFIDMVGRLSWETQLHLDERQYHFQVNKMVILIISVLLVILGMVNVYYVAVLYDDLSGIVNNMDNMHANMTRVSKRMEHITGKVGEFDVNMQHMDNIAQSTEQMSVMMPSVAESMHQIETDVAGMNNNMNLMSIGMGHINERFGHMTQGVAIMRYHVREVARPMGSMNQFIP